MNGFNNKYNIVENTTSVQTEVVFFKNCNKL